MKVSYVASHLC